LLHFCNIDNTSLLGPSRKRAERLERTPQALMTPLCREESGNGGKARGEDAEDRK
jgi:hypothetical protein